MALIFSGLDDVEALRGCRYYFLSSSLCRGLATPRGSKKTV
jgi:hypothetical protein